MSYTMTFDASHKVGRGGGHAQSFFRHIARDADMKAGFEFRHANKNISPTRTRLNLTQVNDGAGSFRDLESIDGRPPSHEFQDYLNERLAAVSRPLRKDAILIRGIIVQLDPKWFEAHNPDWRIDGLNDLATSKMAASMAWVRDEFGQENIVGFSIHLDEYNPQIQVLITPVTADGRLSQKDFFKGPADLRRQHTELRDFMQRAGYDVEKRVTERSTEHLSSSEFQAKADRLRDAKDAVEADKATYETMLEGLEIRRRKLDSRQESLDAQAAELASEQDRAREARALAAEAQQAAAAAQATAHSVHKRAKRELEELRATNERLERVPADVDRWLDKKKFGGQALRDIFNNDMARARATRGDVQKLLADDMPTVEPAAEIFAVE
jgi:hypothetical protein